MGTPCCSSLAIKSVLTHWQTQAQHRIFPTCHNGFWTVAPWSQETFQPAPILDSTFRRGLSNVLGLDDLKPVGERIYHRCRRQIRAICKALAVHRQVAKGCETAADCSREGGRDKLGNNGPNSCVAWPLRWSRTACREGLTRERCRLSRPSERTFEDSRQTTDSIASNVSN